MSEWISVKDRLPEEGQSVAFVVRGDDPLYKGRVLGGNYIRICAGVSEFCHPGRSYFASHWMPLPPPPDEERQP